MALLLKYVIIIFMLIITFLICIGIFNVPANSFVNSTSNNTNILLNNTHKNFENIPLEYDTHHGEITNGTITFSNHDIPIKYEKINGSSIYEGDIILTDTQNNITNRGVTGKFFTSSIWPKGIVPYKIDPQIINKKN